MMEVETIKRRKPWLAALLSLINTGWGQFYCGNWRRGLVLLVADILLGAVMIFAMGSFVGLVICGLVLIGFNLFVVVDAYLSARQAKEYVLQPCNRWWVYGVLVASSLVIGAGLDAASPYETYKIPSESMLHTLQVDDYLMAEKLVQTDTVSRGDILIFLLPEDRDMHFIKRVIGLPGDTVELREGVVYLNGAPLEEPYAVHGAGGNDTRVRFFAPYTVEEGRYFLLGDNRGASRDSRFFGSIEGKDIVARARYIYRPGGGDWSRWGKALP